MKKILVLILALVMMLSLTACGGEKIEITTDNWQDYLEIRQEFVTITETDAFGDTTGERVVNYTMLCLKGEYAGMTVSTDTELVYSFKATEVYYNYSKENGVITKTDKAKWDPVAVAETLSYDAYSGFTFDIDDMLESEYSKVAILPSAGIENSVGILEDIEIERIEGTLVLE